MPLPKLTLFGERVAVTEIEEEITGQLVLPQTAKLGNYELGHVYEVGDKASFVEKGQIVLFQIPNLVKSSTTYRFGREKNEKGETKDVKTAVIHQGDVIGILKHPNVSLENFEIAGNWLLFEIDMRSAHSGILLPDNVKCALEDFHWKLLQKGKGAQDAPANVGDFCLIERTRANPITIGDTEYAFIDSQYLYGIENV